MGFDKLGRPILATQYGSLRLWEMTKLTTVERMTELHAREQELLLRVLRRRTLEGGGGGGGANEGSHGAAAERAGHIVDTAVVVIDTGGLTLRHVSGGPVPAPSFFVIRWLAEFGCPAVSGGSVMATTSRRKGLVLQRVCRVTYAHDKG